DMLDVYLDRVESLLDPSSPRDLRVVYTPLHGVGRDVLLAAFARAGFPDPVVVARQADPDPDFSTVAFPNPEEPGAIDLALSAAAEHPDTDLVIANDPDADRCAVAVHDPEADAGWRMLRGDEVGALLGQHLVRRDPKLSGVFAASIVSSSLLGRIAAAHGLGYAETLTGFKWISRAAIDLVFGYEEALGYAVAPNLVRDKDGISAALLVAELAAALKAAGESLPQRLDELAAEYGRYATDQISIRVDDPALITDTMTRLRAAPPPTLLDEKVTVTDRLPEADVLTLTWTGGRVVVRPSGTEPKLKAYLEVVVADGSRDEATRRMNQLRVEVGARLSS
ncbi:MAG TPA: hypothetical protein VGL39_16030, partial [Jatrophihabitantaceae bacterium]